MSDLKIERLEGLLGSRFLPDAVCLTGGAARLAGAACLMALALPGHAALLSETFDNVTGVTSTTPVGIANVSNPANLVQGSLAVTTNLLDANKVYDVNVRSAADSINGSSVVAGSDFGSFFTSQFLVMGDQSGAIGGNPTGGSLGQQFAYAVPFTVVAGQNNVNVSFDWAFNGVDTSTTTHDDFFAGIAGGSINLSTMTAAGLVNLLFDKTTPTDFGQGSFSQNYTVTSPGTYYVAFVLKEAAGTTTNTAVGIDNITVSAVPVPAAVYLLGSSLISFAGFGARRRPRA